MKLTVGYESNRAEIYLSLLQNTFLVSVDNPFLVSAVLADTIYTI
jgi:hypothetical protein